MRKNSIFLLLIISLSINLFAIPDPVKYGKIEKSLLEMKAYDKDTTADAIIVCDYGSFEANTFTFTRILRIKILKKSGCDRANFAFRTNSRSNIKGLTYNLENGEITETKLKKESIFEEDIDHKYFRYKVTMPNIQVGSVIDIKVYFNGIPSTWHFQSDIPVMWSELRLGTRPEIDIHKNFFGFQSFSIAESDRWVCKDVPALKKEPYMNDIDNFLTKFEIEFSRVSIPGFYFEFATTWEAVNSYLLNESTVGRELQTVFFMGDEAKAINDTCKSQKAKVIAAYEAIKKKIKWNETEYLYPLKNSSIRNVLSKGAGNAGEINIALILLLKKLDIECYPVALSTRNNGMLSLIFPSLDKLNYLIVSAKVDGVSMLLDATDEYLPAGLLPERCINGNGRLVTKTSTVWVDLLPGGVERIKSTANIYISDDGTFTGNIKTNHIDYAAYLFRKNYADFNDKKEYLKASEREYPGLKIKESQIFPIDTVYKPISEIQSFEYSGNAQMGDSTITLLPIAFNRIESNPFKNEVRKMPVDFVYTFDHTFMYNYHIPSGYKLSEMPKNVKLMLPNNDGKFVYGVSANDSVVSVFYNFSIKKTIFSQIEYANVKAWYSEIIKKEAEPIVFKKQF